MENYSKGMFSVLLYALFCSVLASLTFLFHGEISMWSSAFQVSCRGSSKWPQRAPSWSAPTSSGRLSSASTTRSCEVAERLAEITTELHGPVYPSWAAFSLVSACLSLSPQVPGSRAKDFRFSWIKLFFISWDILHCSKTAAPWNCTKASWENRHPRIYLHAWVLWGNIIPQMNWSGLWNASCFHAVFICCVSIREPARLRE